MITFKMCAYNDVNIFYNDLLSTYKEIINIVRFSGDTGIINRKRQLTYKKAIEVIENSVKDDDIKIYIKKLELTEKPRKVMNDLFKTGKVILDSKEPYNGICIEKGKVIKESTDTATDQHLEEIESFQNLIQLTGIGIGIGDVSIKKLTEMGYNNIDQLKQIYDINKFENFSKGLQKSLCKYFEGNVRIEKMSREEATKWKNCIDGIIDSIIESTEDKITFKIAGSYARKKEEIGDIDYVIVTTKNNTLYSFMLNVLDKLSEIKIIDNIPVILDSVVETPSKPSGKQTQYTTSIKMWFMMPNNLKTKIEIYGYSNCEFCFPFFARAADVELQKKIKIHASKKGYKLGPWGIMNKDTNEIAEGSENIKTIKEIYKFLDYKK